MLLRTFNEKVVGLPKEAIIKMSSHSKDYTLQNPDCADNGMFHYEGYGIEYVIDWADYDRCTLEDLQVLLAKHSIDDSVELYSVDVDDGNKIEIKDAIILSDTIILV